MNPERRRSVPVVFGDTPTFLGVPHVGLPPMGEGFDVVFLGVPWEGTVTWGGFSGCELATKTIREASVRYGGYFPEYELNILDILRLGDAGDVRVCPGRPQQTMAEVRRVAGAVYSAGAIPVLFGGDHSYTPEVVAALVDAVEGEVGVIHLDAHLDNLPDYGGDLYARCGPLWRILRTPGVRCRSVVHMGIRGPRNAPLQRELAMDAGCRVLTMGEIRDRGLDGVLDEALERAHQGTSAVYLTICSDILDAACNPGGPPDFDGLWPHELFKLVHEVAMEGIGGLDFVEVYPLQDPHGRSSHLAVWTILHALAGLARGRNQGKGFEEGERR